MGGVLGEFPRSGFFDIRVAANDDFHERFDGCLDMEGFHRRVPGLGFFLNKFGERGVGLFQHPRAVAFRHVEGSIQQVAEAVGEFGVVALFQPFVRKIRVAAGRDVAQEVVARGGAAVAVHEFGGIDNVAEALAHFGAGDVPPAVNEECGHFLVSEAERVEHDEPVNAVRRSKDVFSDDMHGGPAGFEERQVRAGGGIVAGEADVVREGVEPNIGHKVAVEGKLDAPSQARFWTGNAKVSGEFFHRVAEFGHAKVRDDEGISGGGAFVDQVEQPLAVLGEFEVIIFLFDQDDLTPLRAEFAVGTAFFFGEELLLTHAVVAALGGFVEFPFVPKALEHALDAVLVQILDRGGPGVVADVEFLPKRDEKLGDPGHKLGGLDTLLRGGLLDLLAVLVHSGHEKNRLAAEPAMVGDGIG